MRGGESESLATSLYRVMLFLKKKNYIHYIHSIHTSTCDWIYQLTLRFAWGMAVYPLGAVIKIKALCELTCGNLLRHDCNSNRQIFERLRLRSKAASCYCCWVRAFLCEGSPHPPQQMVFFCCIAFSTWHVNRILYFGTICRPRNLRDLDQARGTRNGCSVVVCRSVCSDFHW